MNRGSLWFIGEAKRSISGWHRRLNSVCECSHSVLTGRVRDNESATTLRWPGTWVGVSSVFRYRAALKRSSTFFWILGAFDPRFSIVAIVQLLSVAMSIEEGR